MSTTIEKIATPSEELPITIDTKSFSIVIKQDEVIKKTKSEGETKKKINFIEIDNIEHGRRLRVQAHPNGLVLELVPRYRYYYKAQEDRIIIPGQYTDINQVAKFIVEKAMINNIERGKYTEDAIKLAAQTLKNSGIWEIRGKLKWRNVPDDFWKVVSIENFSIGTIKSYYQWWLSALLKKGAKNNNKNKWYIKDSVHKDIEAGEVPEKLNSIRYWNQLTFDDLMNFVSRGWSAKKQWGQFITQVRPTFYDNLMLKHNDWTENSDNFDSIIEYLARCPKSERMCQALNSLANSGLSAMEIVGLNLTTPKDVERAANYSIKFQAIYRKKQRHLNSNYKVPVLKNVIDEENPENNFIWDNKAVFADHLRFPNLSDEMSCCISRYGSYEDRMVDGYAHALVHEDHTPENKGGFLAYISIRDNGGYYNTNYNNLSPEEQEKAKKKMRWEVQEIRSFNNRNVDPKHRKYVDSVVDQLNKQLPGPHAPVKQMTEDELISELIADPIGQAVKTLWDNQDRRNRARNNYY